MLQAYYLTFFILSVILTVTYVCIWHRHFNASLLGVFILIPLSNLAYTLMYSSTSLETYTAALKVLYMGGCYLPWFVTMTVCNLCHIKVSRLVRAGTFVINTLLYATILSIGYTDLYYKSMEARMTADGIVVTKNYGPFHTVFYIIVGVYFLAGMGLIIYSYFHRKQVSRHVLNLLFLPEAAAMAGYYMNSFFEGSFEIVPVTYVIALVTYLLIARRMSLYGVGEMVTESLVQSGDTGFIIMDFDMNYLGSNETAKEILPALIELGIDQKISGAKELDKTVIHWVDHFKEDENANKNLYIKNDGNRGEEDRIYTVSIDYLFDGVKRRGYQVFLADDTQNQKYIKLLDKYNTELEEEVEEKTRSIVLMHDNLVMSMATMVESRDNSTGGHIKRTSEGVRILIDAIKSDNRLNISDEFCTDIIKAAPMHDLGKIAVDDAILRKPGRFTPEEFEKMKKHAEEGAKTVHEILKTTDDESFKVIAENVAHYHHERWDGSGYPDGLKGEEIPLEARIMAIADVYDALVSKRVYKESMSFEEADRIIMDGMGKHFDDGLREYYLKARSKLEKYYRSNLQNGE